LFDFIGDMSVKFLDSQGFDLSNYTMFYTENWVQEFSKRGGGHHNSHIHWDNHVSAFMYLKCSENTSKPILHDPRPAAVMSKLPEKNGEEVSLASNKIHYNPRPGTIIIAPAYLYHEYGIDNGIDPFRFIHFNLQAVRNQILEGYKNDTRI